MKKTFAIVGVLLLVGAGVWYFMITPQYEQRFPDGWQYETDSLSRGSDPDPELPGGWPEGHSVKDDPITLANRVISASAANAPDGVVEITDHYVVRDPISNAIIWDNEVTLLVDSFTGQIVADDNSLVYFFFPRNVQKTSYTVYNVSPLIVNFQREEEVAGLLTYVFAFNGDYDSTSSTWMELESNQVVTCFDYEQVFWVEPQTGEIVKDEYWCEGDWVVNTDSNERLFPVTRWGGQTTGDDLIRRARVTREMLNTLQVNTLYVPGALALIGIILLAIGFLPKLTNSRKTQ